MRQAAPETAIVVTPRQLEGLIRLARSRARLLLHETITEEDAQRVVDLFSGPC